MQRIRVDILLAFLIMELHISSHWTSLLLLPVLVLDLEYHRFASTLALSAAASIPSVIRIDKALEYPPRLVLAPEADSLPRMSDHRSSTQPFTSLVPAIGLVKEICPGEFHWVADRQQAIHI